MTETDYSKVVPTILATIAQLYRGTGYPSIEQVTSLLLERPRSFKSEDESLPQIISILPAVLAKIPENLRYDGLLNFISKGPWRGGRVKFPSQFAGRSAVLEVAGPEGIAVSEIVRCGFYLQSAECLYPSHEHPAEEFYLVLSGHALWQFGYERFAIKEPGSLIHHPPNVPHAMETLAEPLLAAWVWTGDDLSYGKYRLAD